MINSQEDKVYSKSDALTSQELHKSWFIYFYKFEFIFTRVTLEIS